MRASPGGRGGMWGSGEGGGRGGDEGGREGDTGGGCDGGDGSGEGGGDVGGAVGCEGSGDGGAKDALAATEVAEVLVAAGKEAVATEVAAAWAALVEVVRATAGTVAAGVAAVGMVAVVGDTAPHLLKVQYPSGHMVPYTRPRTWVEGWAEGVVAQGVRQEDSEAAVGMAAVQVEGGREAAMAAGRRWQ